MIPDIFSEQEFIYHVNAFLPSGIRFLSLEEVGSSRSSMTDEINSMVYSLSLDGTQIERLAETWVSRKKSLKNDRSVILLKKIKEGTEAVKPGVVKKIEFFEKENMFQLSVQFDKEHPVRIQDIVKKVFYIDNPVYNMIREKVNF